MALPPYFAATSSASGYWLKLNWPATGNEIAPDATIEASSSYSAATFSRFGSLNQLNIQNPRIDWLWKMMCGFDTAAGFPLMPLHTTTVPYKAIELSKFCVAESPTPSKASWMGTLQVAAATRCGKSGLYATALRLGIALTPLIYSHVTPYGTFRLDMNERLVIETAVASN